MMRISRLIPFLSIVSAGTLAFAADWPQWRGPDRNGASKETGLLKKWPKEGPELAWTFEDAGTGFGSFALVGGRAYVLGARPVDAAGEKRMEQLIALDDKGKERWKADIGPMWDFKTNQWSGGPNSTPCVDGDLVFGLGSQGMLICVKAADGAEVWRKDLVKELGAEVSPGEVKWTSKPGGLPSGSPIYADGCLYCLAADSDEAALLEASPDGYKELGRFTLPKPSAHRKKSGKLWAHPAVSDGRLYLRDQELVFCYKVKAP